MDCRLVLLVGWSTVTVCGCVSDRCPLCVCVCVCVLLYAAVDVM